MFKFVILYYFCCVLAIDGTDFRNHKNWPKDMDEICGDNAQDRIIGGKIAKLGQFPWLVQLAFSYRNMPPTPTCGGSLITRSHVISAAHCVDVPHLHLKYVILGEYNTETDPDCEDNICAAPIQEIKPAHIFKEKYDRDIFKNDIIVIKLEHPADLNGWVTPICLPTGTEKLSKTAEVAGWGWDDSTVRVMQKILKFVKLPIVKMDVCRKYITLTLNKAEQICAGSADAYEDSCGGDSGGPLMQIANSNNSGPRYYQIGIVSYGQNICGYAPAIYTRLTAYMNFVLDVLSK